MKFTQLATDIVLIIRFDLTPSIYVVRKCFITASPSKRWLQQREGAVDKVGQHVPVSAILPACDEQTETKAQQNPKNNSQFVPS